MSDTAKSNKELVRKFMELLSSGRQDEALAFIDPNADWWTANGTMRPADLVEISRSVLPYLAAPLDMQLGKMTAEDDRVSLEAHCTGKRKNGTVYDNNYHFLFTVQNGKIVNVREHQDTRHVAEVWSDVF